jgi:hypothetical protein
MLPCAGRCGVLGGRLDKDSESIGAATVKGGHVCAPDHSRVASQQRGTCVELPLSLSLLLAGAGATGEE